MKRTLTVIIATLIMLGCASCQTRDRYPDNYGTGLGNYDNYDAGYDYNNRVTVPDAVAPLNFQ